MNRLKLLLVLTTVALTSCGATLTTSGTGPTHLSPGTSCGADLTTPIPASSSLWIIRTWSGPEAGSDSIGIAIGAAFTFPTRTVSAGVYDITATPKIITADGDVAYGCSSALRKTLGAKPDTIRNMR